MLGCGDESPRLELATVEADERSADGVFRRLGLRGDGRVVALNSSGAYGARETLAGRILRPTGPADRRRVGPRRAGDLRPEGARHRPARSSVLPAVARVFSMADQPMDLGTAKACIRRCRLMVSTDSGPRHVAAALGLPVITLFGPMLPIWSENPTQQAVNLVLDLDCIGCQQAGLPAGASSLHARLDRGHGFCGPERDVGAEGWHALSSEGRGWVSHHALHFASGVPLTCPLRSVGALVRRPWRRSSGSSCRVGPCATREPRR